MTTTPNRIAQTSKEAQKHYKKHGPRRLPDRLQRQLERAVELEQRAFRIREQAERKRLAKQRREGKEKKEREGRIQSGVGSATQMIGFSHSQAHMKKGMEAFLGVTRQGQQKNNKLGQSNKELSGKARESTKEPWDDSDEDLLSLDVQMDDRWIDEELDDTTLCELEKHFMSDRHEDMDNHMDNQRSEPRPPALSSLAKPPRLKISKDDIEFIRLHGPINKSHEAFLDQMPGPVIELLSHDLSVDVSVWDPAPALLHKLNPVGLPPHRLRIKVGCVVQLLRYLNDSSQLSKSTYLRVIRVEKQRLECLVLDGQLKGTKTLLTRLHFEARHHNDVQRSYKRIQFPICIATECSPRSSPLALGKSKFKRSSPLDHRGRPTVSHNKRVPKPVPRAKCPASLQADFKLPNLPASRCSPLAALCVQVSPNLALDCWDDFVESGTQIARELRSEESTCTKDISFDIHLIHTGDFESELDLDDLDHANEQDASGETSSAVRDSSVYKISEKIPKRHERSPEVRIISASTPNTVPPSQLLAPDPNASESCPFPPQMPNPGRTKRPRPSPRATRHSAEKHTSGSFSEFGLSTQDVTCLIEDDESMMFSSSEVPV